MTTRTHHFICALIFVLAAGCVDEAPMRTKQARELRHLCETLAGRSGATQDRIDTVGAMDLEQFRIGTSTGPKWSREILFDPKCRKRRND